MKILRMVCQICGVCLWFNFRNLWSTYIGYVLFFDSFCFFRKLEYENYLYIIIDYFIFCLTLELMLNKAMYRQYSLNVNKSTLHLKRIADISSERNLYGVQATTKKKLKKSSL